MRFKRSSRSLACRSKSKGTEECALSSSSRMPPVLPSTPCGGGGCVSLRHQPEQVWAPHVRGRENLWCSLAGSSWNDANFKILLVTERLRWWLPLGERQRLWLLSSVVTDENQRVECWHLLPFSNMFGLQRRITRHQYRNSWPNFQHVGGG